MSLRRLALVFGLLLPPSVARAQEPADDAAPTEPLPPPEASPPLVRAEPPPVIHVERAEPPRLRHESTTNAGSWMVLVDYRVALPVGSFQDYVANVSFRGLELGFRYRAHRHLSLGFGGAWQLFAQKKARATYPLDAGAITATLYRSTELVPLLATVHVYPVELGPVKPYAGVGLGTSYVYFQTLVADLGSAKSEWYFTVQPEAGVLIGREDGARSYGVDVSLRYTWMPATFGDVTNIQALGAQIGLYARF